MSYKYSLLVTHFSRCSRSLEVVSVSHIGITAKKKDFGHTLLVVSELFFSHHVTKSRWSGHILFHNPNHNLIFNHKASSNIFVYQGSEILSNAFTVLLTGLMFRRLCTHITSHIISSQITAF